MEKEENIEKLELLLVKKINELNLLKFNHSLTECHRNELYQIITELRSTNEYLEKMLLSMNRKIIQSENFINEITKKTVILPVTLQVSEQNNWDGIKIEFHITANTVYFIEIQFHCKQSNTLLEILNLEQPEKPLISSVLDKNESSVHKFFVLSNDSKDLSIRMSTFKGYSSGEIIIESVKIYQLVSLDQKI